MMIEPKATEFVCPSVPHDVEIAGVAIGSGGRVTPELREVEHTVPPQFNPPLAHDTPIPTPNPLDSLILFGMFLAACIVVVIAMVFASPQQPGGEADSEADKPERIPERIPERTSRFSGLN